MRLLTMHLDTEGSQQLFEIYYTRNLVSVLICLLCSQKYLQM